MSCLLRIAAQGADLVSIAEQAGLSIDSSWSTPEKSESGVRVVVSEAGFEAFAEQVADAITFLSRTGHQIREIIAVDATIDAVLDFGVSTTNSSFRTFTFPATLIDLASTANVSLAISPYPQ
jgi:hypothetical protein